MRAGTFGYLSLENVLSEAGGHLADSHGVDNGGDRRQTRGLTAGTVGILSLYTPRGSSPGRNSGMTRAAACGGHLSLGLIDRDAVMEFMRKGAVYGAV